MSQLAATIWLLHSAQLSDSNTPSNPTFVSPTMSKMDDISTGISVPVNRARSNLFGYTRRFGGSCRTWTLNYLQNDVRATELEWY